MAHWKLRVKPERLVATYNSNKSGRIQWRKTPTIRKTPDGSLSINAERKIKSAIRWLIVSSDPKRVWEKKYNRFVSYRINEATLTFKENLQDDYKGRFILAQWLEMAKYRFDLHNYIWKAEPQDRGAIHFHLVTGVYIPHTELRFTWNRLLRKHGLGEVNKNSTDIHAVTNADNLEAYIASYLTDDKKHEGRRSIKGRLWGCSHALSNAGKNYLCIDTEELKVMSHDLREYALETKYISEGKEPPEFLKYNGYWILPKRYYATLPEGELKQLYNNEIQLLRHKQQKQLFPPLTQ